MNTRVIFEFVKVFAFERKIINLSFIRIFLNKIDKYKFYLNQICSKEKYFLFMIT